MKNLSVLMMFVMTVIMLSSCGGASKNNEAKCDQQLPVGLQLYSVRDAMAEDFKGTLQKVKAMG